MAPLAVKLLKPNPAGCWHCVPAMMQGLDALCGPTVLPLIGPLMVRGCALATPVHANVNNNAKRPERAISNLRLRVDQGLCYPTQAYLCLPPHEGHLRPTQRRHVYPLRPADHSSMQHASARSMNCAINNYV